MKKNAYVIDFTAHTPTLTLTAAFADAANNPESDEYALLCQFQRDFPNLRIVRKTHATPTLYRNSDGTKTARNKHNNLTYERMERFMNALPDSAEYIEAYKKNREIAEAMCASPYSAVSAWFMKQFPQFRSNPLFYLDNKPKVIPYSTVLEMAKAKKSPSVVKIEGEVKKDA